MQSGAGTETGLCLAPPPVVRLVDAGHARLTVAWERLSAADGAEEDIVFDENGDQHEWIHSHVCSGGPGWGTCVPPGGEAQGQREGR